MNMMKIGVYLRLMVFVVFFDVKTVEIAAIKQKNPKD